MKGLKEKCVVVTQHEHALCGHFCTFAVLCVSHKLFCIQYYEDLVLKLCGFHKTTKPFTSKPYM